MTSPRSSPLPGHLRIASLAAPLALLVACATTPTTQTKTGSAIARGPFVSFDERGNPTIDVVSESALTLEAMIGSSVTRVPFEKIGGARARATVVTDAPAGTRVAYRIIEGGFDTSPLSYPHELTLVRRDPEHALTFCALGDSGVYHGSHAGKPQLSVAKLLEDLHPDLVIHVGDLVYPAGEESGFDPLFFAPYAKTLGRVPFFVALGNHDVKTEDGRAALSLLPFPTGKPASAKWYSFDAGPVHFVALDSNPIAYGKVPFEQSEQGRWFQKDVAQTQARWKVVFFHHPLYSVKDGRESQRVAMRRGLERALVDAKVDLVLSGHDHFYHRSKPVFAGAPSEKGIVHVLTGGGGADLYDGEPDRSGVTASFHEKHHAVRVRVEKDSAHVEALAPGDAPPIVLDSFSLAK